MASSSSGIGFELDEQEVRVGRMLTDVFIDDPDAEAFSELTIEVENLTRWDRREDIMSHIEYDPGHPCGEKWKVTVDPVAPLTVTVDDLTTVPDDRLDTSELAAVGQESPQHVDEAAGEGEEGLAVDEAFAALAVVELSGGSVNA
ncbi:MAG: hypothetical protein JWP83_241 [Mycobacterium sp.]|jgi:hypothetical protein|nr:hypothetical protein [Mycobacterium sp.]